MLAVRVTAVASRPKPSADQAPSPTTSPPILPRPPPTLPGQSITPRSPVCPRPSCCVILAPIKVATMSHPFALRPRNTRRGFMQLAGAGLAGIVGGPWQGIASAAEGPETDLVVFNAETTQWIRASPKPKPSPSRPAASLAVGATAEMKALIGKGTQTVRRATGMTVVPGFIDCHNHAPGDDPALRGPRRQPLRGRIRHHRQHRRQTAGASPRTRRPAPGSRAISSTTPRSRTNASSTSTTSTRFRRDTRGRSPPRRPHLVSTTARRSKWRTSTRTRPNPAGGTYRQRRQRRAQRPRHRSRAQSFDKVGKRPIFHRRAKRAARPRRPRLHLQAIRPLRPHQRPP